MVVEVMLSQDGAGSGQFEQGAARLQRDFGAEDLRLGHRQLGFGGRLGAGGSDGGTRLHPDGGAALASIGCSQRHRGSLSAASFRRITVDHPAADALGGLALDRLQRAWERGRLPGAQERGETSLAVAAGRLYDITGARGAAGRYGFDRFWRNVRTHSLHDPLD